MRENTVKEQSHTHVWDELVGDHVEPLGLRGKIDMAPGYYLCRDCFAVYYKEEK